MPCCHSLVSKDVLGRLAAVQLVDAHLCTDAGKYMSALLLCLGTMLHLELPHVNLLSKMDLLPSYGPLDFNLEFYTEVSRAGCVHIPARASLVGRLLAFVCCDPCSTPSIGI